MALYFGNKKYSLSVGSSQGTLHLNSKVRLPNIYQEVSYLEAEVNTETYIDLGFAFDTSAEIYITQIVPNGAVTSYLFGAVEKEGILRCCLSSPYGQAATLYGSNTTAYGSSVVGFNGLHGLNEYKIIIKKGNREIINLTTGKTSGISSGQGEYIMASNLYLFAQNYNGTVRYGSKRIISAFKYYDKNGDLICDLIPCYRKSDNVRGMYDTARKIFLTNIGTGADFTIGELINK